MRIGQYETHPAADLFPMMDGAEFTGLVKDIKENGLNEAIWRDVDGLVLDGRNRLKACLEANVTPQWRTFRGDSPTAFVVSCNLHRRHLSNEQKAMLAPAIKASFEGEAAERRSATLKQNQDADVANLPERTEPGRRSRDDAAAVLGISPRTVENACKVDRDGIPELREAVRDGKASVSAAAIVATLPEEEQRLAVEFDTVAETAKAVKAHVSHNSGENEWYTPKEYIEAARSTMGSIDCDPASCEAANKTVGASKYFTDDDDGLKRTWMGNVWMNPPYSQPLIAQFADALIEKYRSDEINQAVVLVNNATETAWFQTLACEASAVCFPRTRIRFVDRNGNPSKNGPLQGQAVLYFGDRINAFCEAFKEGTIWVKPDRE